MRHRYSNFIAIKEQYVFSSYNIFIASVHCGEENGKNWIIMAAGCRGNKYLTMWELRLSPSGFQSLEVEADGHGRKGYIT